MEMIKKMALRERLALRKQLAPRKRAALRDRSGRPQLRAWATRLKHSGKRPGKEADGIVGQDGL
jgi:hypothetical protein